MAGSISGSDPHIRGVFASDFDGQALTLWWPILSPGVGTVVAAALTGSLGVDTSVQDDCPLRPDGTVCGPTGYWVSGYWLDWV